MARIKCTACPELRREKIAFSGKSLMTFRCPLYPYATTIGGLVRPGKGVREAVEKCRRNPRQSCTICRSGSKLHRLGGIFDDDCVAVLCGNHYHAWSEWLDSHPEHRQRLAPKGRVVHANWVDVFREFVEEMRPQRQEGAKT